MTSIESILHKGAAYTRFRIAVCVMQEVLEAAPEVVCTGKLEHAAGCSARTLARVCANLVQAGILSPADSAKAAWLPGPAADDVTLADILCSEIGSRPGNQEKPLQAPYANPARRQDMDAFLLQATMKINQTVLEQLRRFPLRKPGGGNGVTVPGA